MAETNCCPFKKKFVDVWGLEQTQGREFFFSIPMTFSQEASLQAPLLRSFPWSVTACLFAVRARSLFLCLIGYSPVSTWAHERCPTYLLNEWTLKFSPQGLAWGSSCLSSIFSLRIRMLWRPSKVKTAWRGAFQWRPGTVTKEPRQRFPPDLGTAGGAWASRAPNPWPSVTSTHRSFQRVPDVSRREAMTWNWAPGSGTCQ